jgi:hypothetical protein
MYNTVHVQCTADLLPWTLPYAEHSAIFLCLDALGEKSLQISVRTTRHPPPPFLLQCEDTASPYCDVQWKEPGSYAAYLCRLLNSCLTGHIFPLELTWAACTSVKTKMISTVNVQTCIGQILPLLTCSLAWCTKILKINKLILLTICMSAFPREKQTWRAWHWNELYHDFF